MISGLTNAINLPYNLLNILLQYRVAPEFVKTGAGDKTGAVSGRACFPYRKTPINSAAGTWFLFLMVRLPSAALVTAHFLKTVQCPSLSGR
jgi:hypothetical protein